MAETIEQIQRRPEYLETFEKGLLDALLGQYTEDGGWSGGIIRDPQYFQIPQYQIAGRSELETLPEQALMGDANSNGVPDFLERYQPYFQQAGQFMTGGQEALYRGLGALGDAVSYFGPAAQYVSSGAQQFGAGDAFSQALSPAAQAAREATMVGSSGIGQGFGEFGAGEAFGQALSPAAQAAREAAMAGTSGIGQGLGEFGAGDVFGGALLPAQMAASQSALSGIEAAAQGMGRFSPSDVTQFMDPYRQQVIDEAMKQIERQGDVARQRAAAQAVGSGAFGGSRQGLQAAEVERAIADTKAGAISDLLSSGYSEALQRAMQADEQARARALQTGQISGQLGLEASRQLGALGTTQAQAQQAAFEDAMRRALSGGQATGQLGLEAARQLGALGTTQAQAQQAAFEDASKRALSGGQAIGQLGLETARQLGALGTTQAQAQQAAFEDASKRSLEAGRLMGGLGQSMGQLGSTFGTLGQQYGQLGGTTADIGRVYSALAPADLATMAQFGEAARNYQQSALDTARQEAMRPTQQALLPYNYAYSVLSGTPSASLYNQYTTTQQPAANPYLSGLGAYTALQGVYGQQ